MTPKNTLPLINNNLYIDTIRTLSTVIFTWVGNLFASRGKYLHQPTVYCTNTPIYDSLGLVRKFFSDLVGCMIVVQYFHLTIKINLDYTIVAYPVL